MKKHNIALIGTGMIAKSHCDALDTLENANCVDGGEFGDIYMADFSRCSERQYWGNDWLFDPQRGGGAMHDMMVHDIDYMNYLFGPAKSVYTLAAKDDTGCYNNVFASLTYRNGVRAAAETSFNMSRGFPFTMAAKIGRADNENYTLFRGLEYLGI